MKRQNFLQQSSLLGLGSLFPSHLFAHADHDHGSASEFKYPDYTGVLGHGEHQYKVAQNWPNQTKKDILIHNCHAMVESKDGNFHALCDGIQHNFVVYSPKGDCIKKWGTEYPGAHGLDIFEENGKEYFIVVDGGWAIRNKTGKANREQGKVVKISKDGSLIFNIGHPMTVGAYEPNMRFQPCDAAISPNGDIYVADGYGSQWVLHYDKHGRFIRKFGGPGNEPQQLKGAHGISIDTRDPAFPKVIVSSRSESKLKFFDLDGKFLFHVEVPGALLGQAAVHGDHLYSGVCWSKDPKTGKRLKDSGFVTILDGENKVVSNLGGSEPIYKKGKLEPLYQTNKLFNHVHDVCVDHQGNIYALQWNAKGALPIKLEKVT